MSSFNQQLIEQSATFMAQLMMNQNNGANNVYQNMGFLHPNYPFPIAHPYMMTNAGQQATSTTYYAVQPDDYSNTTVIQLPHGCEREPLSANYRNTSAYSELPKAQAAPPVAFGVESAGNPLYLDQHTAGPMRTVVRRRPSILQKNVVRSAIASSEADKRLREVHLNRTEKHFPAAAPAVPLEQLLTDVNLMPLFDVQVLKAEPLLIPALSVSDYEDGDDWLKSGDLADNKESESSFELLTEEIIVDKAWMLEAIDAAEIQI